MRIGIDTRDLLIAKTGTRTYLEELCTFFPLVAPQHEFIHLRPKWQVSSVNNLFTKILNHIAYYWWKEVELPWLAWRAKCDLLFCSDYVVPLFAHCPTIPVFHDANFWATPSQYNSLWRQLINILALPAAKKSPFVVTVSEFSRREIAQFTGIALHRLVVIPNAPKSTTLATRTVTDDELNKVLKRYHVDPNIPFILHVGVLEKRKNLPRLIEAFGLFLQRSKTQYQLVLLGQPGPKRNLDDSRTIRAAISRLGLEQNVNLVGYVDDKDLAVFYQKATAFVFPSLREGFGIPLLEAFINDLPVAAANSTAIPEITGDAAFLFDPFDINDIANALQTITSQQTLRNALIERGRKRSEQFSWSITARRLIRLFEEVVDYERAKNDT